MKDKIKEGYMYILGGVIIFAMFFIVGLLIFIQIPKDNADVFYMAVGQLLTGALAVIFYFYGSSKSSNDKTKILNGNSINKKD